MTSLAIKKEKQYCFLIVTLHSTLFSFATYTIVLDKFSKENRLNGGYYYQKECKRLCLTKWYEKEKHTSGIRLIVKALIPLCLVFGASSIYVMLEVVSH